jgi:hypothetical protein
VEKIIGREEMFSQELEKEGSSSGPKERLGGRSDGDGWMDIWDDSLVD